MSNRKLLIEIERVLKKVDEGVAVFEQIWDKVYSASTTAQKEKYEADLKKEIKKLQRLRDQIKTWQGDSSVKDKTKLDSNRKLIEAKMEKFKVCEKETKTKAFSKEGLAQDRTDPRQKAKAEVGDWVREAISKLREQSDQFEAEIEQLNSGGKRKKRGEEPPRVGELKLAITRHEHHVVMLERVLRAVDNDQVTPDQCNKELRENVDYYLEANQDVDFFEDDGMYDCLDLDTAVPVPAPGGGASVGGGTSARESRKSAKSNGNVVPSDSSHGDAGSYSSSALGAGAAGSTPFGSGTGSAGANGGPPAATVGGTALHSPKGSRSSRSNGSGELGMSPTSGGRGGGQSARGATTISPSKRGGNARDMGTSPSRGAGHVKGGQAVVGRQQVLGAQVPSSQGQLHAASMQSHVASSQGDDSRGSSGSLPLMSAVVKGHGLQGHMFPPVAATGATQQQHHHQQHQQLHQHQQQLQQQMHIQQMQHSQSQMSQQQQRNRQQEQSSQRAHHQPQDSQAQHQRDHLPQSMQHSHLQHPHQQQQLHSRMQEQQLQQHQQQRLQSHQLLIQQHLQRQQQHALHQQQVPGAGGRGTVPDDSSSSGLVDDGAGMLGSGEAQFVQPGASLSGPEARPDASSASAFSQSAGSGVHVAEAELAALEVASLLMPETPANHPLSSASSWPASFPTRPAPVFENPAVFEKFDPDALFFIFYYHQGTYQQYLASNELKRLGWRFHKKYRTWFFLLNRPEVVTDKYQTGTFVYFEYANIVFRGEGTGWCQRVKEDFTFEYRYLE